MTILALLVALVASLAFRAENITSCALHVALIAVPILLQIYFNSGLTCGPGRFRRIGFAVHSARQRPS